MNFRRTLLLTTSILVSSAIHGYSSNLSSSTQSATSSITGVKSASVAGISASALSSSISGYMNAPVMAQNLKSVSGSAYSIVNTFYTNLQKALQSPSAQSISVSNLTNLNNALASFQQVLMGVTASYAQNYQTSTVTNYLTTFLATGSSGFINNISNGTSVDSSASTIVSRLGSLTPYLQQKVPQSFTTVYNTINTSNIGATLDAAYPTQGISSALTHYYSNVLKRAMTMSSADLTNLNAQLQSLQTTLGNFTIGVSTNGMKSFLTLVNQSTSDIQQANVNVLTSISNMIGNMNAILSNDTTYVVNNLFINLPTWINNTKQNSSFTSSYLFKVYGQISDYKSSLALLSINQLNQFSQNLQNFYNNADKFNSLNAQKQNTFSQIFNNFSQNLQYAILRITVQNGTVSRLNSDFSTINTILSSINSLNF